MSMARSLQVIYHAARKGELDKARYYVDIVLGEVPDIASDAVEDLAGLIAELAQAFRREGRHREAIGEMQRSLALQEHDVNRAILDFWAPLPSEEKPVPVCPFCRDELSGSPVDECSVCHRRVRLCGACGQANRILDVYCRYCGKKIEPASPDASPAGSPTPMWFFPFEFPATAMSAPPVVNGDLVFLAPPGSNELIVLKLETGELHWSQQDLFSGTHYPRLTAAPPFTYVFADRCVSRLLEVGDSMEIETVYSDDAFQPDTPAATLLENGVNSAVFLASGKSFFVHHLLQKHPKILTVDLAAGDSLLPPVVSEGRVYLLSGGGRMLVYVLNRDLPFDDVFQISDCTICGPPLSRKRRIVFEALIRDSRRFFVWDPTKPMRSPRCTDLPDVNCSPEDSHFLQAPLAYREGAVMTADEHPALHLIRNVSDAPEAQTKQVEINTGPIRVSNIEPQLSATHDSILYSWIPNGFFWVSLDDPSDGGIEFFGSDLLSAPVVSGTCLILTCQDGVRCYAL